jgi:hypothetical protein
MSEIDTKDRARAAYLASRMEQAHVRFARESFAWSEAERRRGYFDWRKFDQAVEVALAHNVAVLGRLEFTAPWASSAPASVPPADRVYYPPADVADFAAYARATVRRYKDRVHFWQIWNEPNNASYWRPAPSAAAYTALLKAAYAAIKAEDPTAKVLLGGVSPGPDPAFVDGIFANGGWSSFDIFAMHTYIAVSPLAPTSMMRVWLDMAAQTLAQKGAKPLWITEFGWSTYAGSGPGYIGVSEGAQAAYILEAYQLAAARGVQGIALFSLEDYGTSPTSVVDNYGTITKGGRHKPSYSTLTCAGHSLDHGLPPACRVDRIAGPDRYATAAAISASHHLPGVPVAYVATGLNFPDALAGAAAAGKVGAPLLLVTRDSLPAATAAELARLRPGRIIVLGATGVVSDATGLAAMSAAGL